MVCLTLEKNQDVVIKAAAIILASISLIIIILVTITILTKH